MPPFLIIDGYNLLHAAGMARDRYGPGDLERCRQRLLTYLARRLSPAERGRTTIVFDAGDAPSDLPRQFRLDDMEVRFAERGGDADSMIEELIAGHSAPRRIRVVSSDHRLQNAARRRRAAFIESHDFVVRLDQRPAAVEDPTAQRRAPPRSHPKYTGDVSPDETARWLHIFGDVSTAEHTTQRPADPPPEPATDPASSPPEESRPPPSSPRPARPRPRSRSPATGSDVQSATTDEEARFWQARVDELREEGEAF